MNPPDVQPPTAAGLAEPPEHWRLAKLLEETTTNTSWHSRLSSELQAAKLPPLDPAANSKSVFSTHQLETKVINLGRLLQLPQFQRMQPQVWIGGRKEQQIRKWLTATGYSV